MCDNFWGNNCLVFISFLSFFFSFLLLFFGGGWGGGGEFFLILLLLVILFSFRESGISGQNAVIIVFLSCCFLISQVNNLL